MFKKFKKAVCLYLIASLLLSTPLSATPGAGKRSRDKSQVSISISSALGAFILLLNLKKTDSRILDESPKTWMPTSAPTFASSFCFKHEDCEEDEICNIISLTCRLDNQQHPSWVLPVLIAGALASAAAIVCFGKSIETEQNLPTSDGNTVSNTSCDSSEFDDALDWENPEGQISP